MIIRDASIEDAGAIAEVYLLARKRFLPYAPLARSDNSIREWILQSLIPAGGVTVVELDSCVVGFMSISRDGVSGWIDQMYLAPAAIGQGIGALLMERAKELLGAPIRIYTFQKNDGARRFYQRHGFREILLSDGALNEERTPDVLLEWVG